ncbi:MAG: hypothetical protein ACXVIQ_14620, partial [Ilumatobacteraceae bacterium]
GGAMRFTIRFLGHDLLDVDLSTDSPSPEPDDTSRDDRGSFTSYPIGFVASMDKPHEMDMPDRDL